MRADLLEFWDRVPLTAFVSHSYGRETDNMANTV